MISDAARAVAADQEIEVRPLVGLHHVVDVQTVVTTWLADARRRLPFGATPRELSIRNLENESALGNVEPQAGADPHTSRRP